MFGFLPPPPLFYNLPTPVCHRTHSLHERTLAFSTKIEVRQVRFHPGSPNDNHICLLTNDNVFRIFCIDNSDLIPQGVFKIGPSITCNVPSSMISFQEALGEVAVDFDFGPPEISARPKSLTKKYLKWPVYFLSGDATLYVITITLGDKTQPEVMGPFTIRPLPEGKMNSEYCSLAVFNTTPPLLSIANCNGHVSHVLAFEENPQEDDVRTSAKKRRNFMLLETLELELGYTVGNYSSDAEYSCPIYLHKDSARLGNYFATHETGVHSIEMGCVDYLQKYVEDNEEDLEEALQGIFNEQSSIFYLLCTKTSDDQSATNPVIGFSFYYNPYSYLCFLGNGQLVSQPVVTTAPQEDFQEHDIDTFPLKKIINNQFDQQIQRILKQGTVQPILKLSSEGKTQQDCYELIKRSAIALREQFANNERARIEIEKRIKALRLLKEYQSKELENIAKCKMDLQDNAERLAEKYENLNCHQDDILKRCQKLLISISKLQDVPSHAEKEFHTTLKAYETKIGNFQDAVGKLRKKISYQEYQMKNHEAQVQKKREINNEQAETFKSSLKETTRKISQMVKEVNDYKNQLNLN